MEQYIETWYERITRLMLFDHAYQGPSCPWQPEANDDRPVWDEVYSEIWREWNDIPF